MEKKEKDFEQQIMDSGRIPNFSAAAVFILYVIFFANISGREFLQSLVAGLCVFAILQFVLGPFTNANSSRSLSKRIKDWKSKGLDDKGRTQLLIDLMRCPIHVGKSVMCVFGGGTLVWAFYFWLILKVSMVTFVFIIFSSFYAAYVAAIIGILCAEKVCSKYAMELVSEGVIQETIEKKQFFGFSVKNYFRTFIIIPVIISSVSTFAYVAKEYFQNIDINQFSLIGVCIMVVLNTIMQISLSLFLGFRFLKYLKEMQIALTKNAETTISENSLVPTDLANEFSYNLHLINKNTLIFVNVLAKAAKIGQEIATAIQNLVVISTENSSVSVEQSSGVRQIVSAMEDSDKLSKNISSKISNVTDIAMKNVNDVQNGFETLSVNLEKMSEISESNISTISGIKQLSEQIENIWDIVNIISGIADQTKIIAFNAELEAASAGEAGKNFHIVANEIRRLADNTMDSTKDIKERITAIQHSSDNLIVTSEGGTEKINEGCALSSKLEENFQSIKSSSEITVESSNDIKEIIEQQTSSFEQIVITLKQISAGIETSATSIQSFNDLALQLQTISDSLAVLKDSAKE